MAGAHDRGVGGAGVRPGRGVRADQPLAPGGRRGAGPAQRIAARLSECRGQLEALVDEDGAAITGFETLRDAGEVRQAQDRLCRMPLEMGSLAAEAAALLQEFRPLVRVVQDDLEMAITLLTGAARGESCWTPTCASGLSPCCWRNLSRRWPGFESRRRASRPASVVMRPRMGR